MNVLNRETIEGLSVGVERVDGRLDETIRRFMPVQTPVPSGSFGQNGLQSARAGIPLFFEVIEPADLDWGRVGTDGTAREALYRFRTRARALDI